MPLSVWTNFVPFWPGGLVADVEASGLIIGAIRRAGDLAVLAGLAAAGHPGLEVELAIGRAAEVARADVEHAIGQPSAWKISSSMRSISRCIAPETSRGRPR